ncbi:hypothetical protein CF319_g3931 [Tilletia indica]|nr:hypothetical protein CF319_g3931 [Tilletia indica]
MLTQNELRDYLSRYDEALQVRSEAHRTSSDVVNLDRWYRTTLRNTLKKRRAEKAPYMSKDEMVKLMKWKLARGKWRPRLQQYIEEHAEEEIVEATRDMFTALDQDEANSSGSKEPIARDTLRKLTQLRGIGPATASAVLAAYEPERFPFLSDEAAVGVGKLGDKADYTEAFLERFIARMHERVAAEGWADVDELERACFAGGIIKKYGSASEGQKGREKGKKKEVQELFDGIKHSSTAEQRTAKYARPDAATAHGGDKLKEEEDETANPEASSKGKGRAHKAKKTKKEEADLDKPSSSTKKRKATDHSTATQGERKSARLASK